ncbi:family 1 glycosylhydrolase [Streptomyces griseoviridis]|uniref:Beta-glucosidase n=1 Tax=Streptomyces griseoviridis TaxID=45398 RepID=A0ABT9LPK2_STRGD|nr:family 1 glycosylhydrolase [Streptomyces griseoviridis]MDP9685430.1 beta-glucosidase [Streptomyces griseoviridis]GGS87344.1 beta-glucosidase [Streptomyces griseoviridis]
MTHPRLPADFLWGVATAGHQNEGDNTAGDTWFLEHTTPSLFREPSGPACRGYEHWAADLDLVAGLGLNAFRFSVEWARVEPERGTVSAEALDHYERMVDGCLERGLAPVVTFSHFTAPHWFAAAGSWTAADAPARFAEQCDRVTARFGDRIACAVTLNEPNLEQLLQAGAKLPPEAERLKEEMLAAAARAAGSPGYGSANVIPAGRQEEFQEAFTRAHRAAREAVKARRADLPLGVSIALADEVAVPGGEERRNAKRAAVYDHWLREARHDDFIGVQNYERIVHGPDGEVLPDGERNGMGTVIEPASLAGAVRYAHEVAGVPVLVTEHGIQTADDTQRATFIPAAVDALAAEIAAGTPVLGYCHWTLMDNFEWIFGYGAQLGLHEVDRTTFRRRPKPSAAAYADVVRRYRDGLAQGPRT